MLALEAFDVGIRDVFAFFATFRASKGLGETE